MSEVETTEEVVQENKEVVSDETEAREDNLVVNIEEPITQEQIEATMWDVSEAPVE